MRRVGDVVSLCIVVAVAIAIAEGLSHPATSRSALLRQAVLWTAGAIYVPAVVHGDPLPDVQDDPGKALDLAPPVRPGYSRIILTRHGQTDYNARHVCQGRRLNPHLNPTGRAQAARLADALRGRANLLCVASSPLLRARETADAVRQRQLSAARAEVLEELNEVDFGGAEGKLDVLAAVQLRPAYQAWSRGNWGARAGGGGESGREAQARARAAARALAALAGDGGTVLAVSHSSFIKFVLGTLLDVPLEDVRCLGQGNCAVNVLDCDRRTGRFSALVLNNRPYMRH